MDRSSRQKINKETAVLNSILDHMDLIDIYTTSCPKTTGYTYFTSAHGTFFRKDYMLGHKKVCKRTHGQSQRGVGLRVGGGGGGWVGQRKVVVGK